MSQEPKEIPNMDAADLWKEEVFTDRKVGTIRRLSPVKADGAPDAGRATLYLGEASLYTPGGTLPLAFEIPAQSLDKAVALYGECAAKAFEEAMEELQEMRRKASSSIVIPKAGAAGLQGAGLGPGMPPGKLHLP